MRGAGAPLGAMCSLVTGVRWRRLSVTEADAEGLRHAHVAARVIKALLEAAGRQGPPPPRRDYGGRRAADVLVVFRLIEAAERCIFAAASAWCWLRSLASRRALAFVSPRALIKTV